MVSICSVALSSENFSCQSQHFKYRQYSEIFTYLDLDHFFDEKQMHIGNFEDFDVAFFRIDRVPGHPEAIYDYFKFVEKIAPKLRYVNSPSGLILTKSKTFLNNFTDVCPKFAIVQSIGEAFEAFINDAFVLKPLDGYGGRGIIKVTSETDISTEERDLKNIEALNYLRNIPPDYFPVMAMKYMKNISEGDKRIIITAGKCLGAVLRVPKNGSWLANLAQGASSCPAEPTQEELEIICRIDPILRKHNILVYGIDTLVNDNGKRTLSEINTANVGGFLQIQNTSGRPVLREMADLILESLKA